MAPIPRRTMAEEVGERIIAAISYGEMKPGDRVVEQDVAEALGVSRVPVREAIRRLEAQGILTPSRRRGSSVAVFDQKRIGEIKEVRIAIERIAIRDAIPRFAADPALDAGLDQLLAHMERCAEAGDAAAMNRADLDFHRYVCAVSDHGAAQTVWEGLSGQVLILFGIELYRDPDLAVVVREHAELAELIRAGAVDRIDAAIAEHIAGERFRVLKQTGGPAPRVNERGRRPHP